MERKLRDHLEVCTRPEVVSNDLDQRAVDMGCMCIGLGGGALGIWLELGGTISSDRGTRGGTFEGTEKDGIKSSVVALLDLGCPLASKWRSQMAFGDGINL